MKIREGSRGSGCTVFCHLNRIPSRAAHLRPPSVERQVRPSKVLRKIAPSAPTLTPYA